MDKKPEITETTKRKYTKKKVVKKTTEPSIVPEVDMAKLKEELKEELLKEFKSDVDKTSALNSKRRNLDDKKQKAYVAAMKKSEDFWFSFTCRGPETEEGLKIETDWNTSFIDYLKSKNMTGANDDQLIQNWIIMFLHTIVNNNVEETEEEKQSTYE